MVRLECMGLGEEVELGLVLSRLVCGLMDDELVEIRLGFLGRWEVLVVVVVGSV